MSRRASQLLALLIAGSLAACGGGSSNGSGSTSGGSTTGGSTSGGSTSGGSTSGGSTSGGSTSGGSTSGGSTSGGSTTGGSTSGGSTAAGSAAECLNKNLYQTAATVVLNYNISGTLTGTSQSTSVSNPSANFQGTPASEWSQSVTTTYVGAPQAIVTNKYYYQLDGNVVVSVGNIADITTPLAGTITTVFSPAYRDQRWTLSAGQEVTGTITTNNTASFAGIGGGTTSTTTTVKVRYDGRESVTVPAGTYNTCKFTENDGATIVWYEPNAGVAVKTFTSGSGSTATLELTSGTVNGAAI